MSTSRGPPTTPLSRQSDGFAASAARQQSVRPLPAIGAVYRQYPSSVTSANTSFGRRACSLASAYLIAEDNDRPYDVSD